MRDFDLASLVLPALEVGPEGWTSKPCRLASVQRFGRPHHVSGGMSRVPSRLLTKRGSEALLPWPRLDFPDGACLKISALFRQQHHLGRRHGSIG